MYSHTIGFRRSLIPGNPYLRFSESRCRVIYSVNCHLTLLLRSPEAKHDGTPGFSALFEQL